MTQPKEGPLLMGQFQLLILHYENRGTGVRSRDSQYTVNPGFQFHRTCGSDVWYQPPECGELGEPAVASGGVV